MDATLHFVWLGIAIVTKLTEMALGERVRTPGWIAFFTLAIVFALMMGLSSSHFFDESHYPWGFLLSIIIGAVYGARATKAVTPKASAE